MNLPMRVFTNGTSDLDNAFISNKVLEIDVYLLRRRIFTHLELVSATNALLSWNAHARHVHAHSARFYYLPCHCKTGFVLSHLGGERLQFWEMVLSIHCFCDARLQEPDSNAGRPPGTTDFAVLEVCLSVLHYRHAASQMQFARSKLALASAFA